jgi:hypothetical protein
MFEINLGVLCIYICVQVKALLIHFEHLSIPCQHATEDKSRQKNPFRRVINALKIFTSHLEKDRE